MKNRFIVPFQINRITVFGRDAEKKEREEKNFKGKTLSLEKAFSERE